MFGIFTSDAFSYVSCNCCWCVSTMVVEKKLTKLTEIPHSPNGGLQLLQSLLMREHSCSGRCLNESLLDGYITLPAAL